jgi:hypothetical protein
MCSSSKPFETHGRADSAMQKGWAPMTRMSSVGLFWSCLCFSIRPRFCCCWWLQGSYDRRPRLVLLNKRTPRPPAFISGMGQKRSADHVDGLPRTRQVHPSNRTPRPPAVISCMARRRNSTGLFHLQSTRRGRGRDHSRLMPANSTTLAHFSVSSATSLVKSLDEPKSAEALRSASLALIVGLARSRIDSLLSRSMIPAGVFLGTPMLTIAPTVERALKVALLMLARLEDLRDGRSNSPTRTAGS